MGEPGSHLRNFEILEPIGRGGMGVLHKGIQKSLGRTVAIKRMHAHLASDPAFLSRFESEARTAATLDHPNVVRVIDFGREGDECFIAMEFVDGPDLRSLLDRLGRPSLGASLSIGLDLARGLACAHAAGVVHRDVKPANVLLAPDGTAKLADFSIARAADLPSLTEPGRAVGTPSYMSPEQAIGRASGAASDVFSAAIVLYELLCGRTPFGGDSYAEVMRRLITETLVPASVASPDVPEAVSKMLERALDRDPARRTADGAALLREIETASAGLGASRDAVADLVRRFASMPKETAARTETVAVRHSEVLPDPSRVDPPTRPAPPLLRRIPKRAAVIAGVAVLLVATALAIPSLRRRAGERRADAAAEALRRTIAASSSPGDAAIEGEALRLLGASPDDLEVAWAVGGALAGVDDPNARMLALQQLTRCVDGGVHADDPRIAGVALKTLETTPPDPAGGANGANEIAQRLLRVHYPAARRIWAEGAIDGTGPALLSAVAALQEDGDPRAKQPWLTALADAASGDAARLARGEEVLLQTDDPATLGRAVATLRTVRDLPAMRPVQAPLDALLARLDERLRVLRGGMPSPTGPAYAPIIATGNPFFYPVPRDQNLACYALAGSDPDKCDGISDHDGKQLCLAAASEKSAPCGEIASPDLQLACRGMVDEAPARCAKIGDPNLRAFCEGVAAHDPKRCVIADGDAAHLCFALATHVPSNCRVVHGIDDRAFCVAVSHRDTILCGPIRR